MIVTENDDLTRVTFAGGEITEEIEQLVPLLDRLGERQLLLDLGRVDYLDARALGNLIRLFQHARAHGRCLALCNLRPSLRDILLVTRLDGIFGLTPPVQEQE
jgi:anti-sigma B factor antagonist